MLKQCPVDVVPLLLQRGLARALMGGADKAAISDYLRAYLKDKEATIEVDLVCLEYKSVYVVLTPPDRKNLTAA